MRTHSGARTRAFTLLEVMVALAIFSIALLAMIPLFGMASWGARGGKELTSAQTLARTYVDKLRNTPFFNIGTGTGCPNACTPPAAEVATNAPFQVTWSVTAVDGTAYNFGSPPTPSMKRLTVTVTKPCADCAGQQRRVQMTTIVSERS